MSAARCYTIDVDGEPASVRLAKAPADLAGPELEAIRDVIRTARRTLTNGPTNVLAKLECELAEAVAHRDTLPAQHPRRVPLERRITRLSSMIAARRQERAL